MGSAKDFKTGKYCDEVLTELAYMIQNIQDLRAYASETLGRDDPQAGIHDRHLADIAEYLDWKLQILTSSCPYEWNGLGENVERTVSVREPDPAVQELAGGYLGG